MTKVRLSLLAVVALLGAGVVTAVFAHAAVITQSIPANGAVLAESPPEVTVWFAEELRSPDSTLSVFDATGKQVDSGGGGVDLTDPDHASMTVAIPPLPDGSYIVQYHVVLLDGDPTDGAYAFAIGEEQTVVQPTPAAETAEAGVSTGTWVLVIGGAVTAVTLLLFFFILRRQPPANPG